MKDKEEKLPVLYLALGYIKADVNKLLYQVEEMYSAVPQFDDYIRDCELALESLSHRIDNFKKEVTRQLNN